MNNPALLWSLWDMLQLPIGPLLGCFQRLITFSQTASLESKRHAGMKLDHPEYGLLRTALTDFIGHCREIGLNVTERIAKEALVEFDLATSDETDRIFDWILLGRLERKFGALALCLRTEAETKVSLVLDPDKAALFEPREPHFGSDVRSKFPRAIYEIDEAAKCLALGRATAVVFHLMRALEVVLKAVSACLDLPPPENPNWSTWLTPIRLERLRRGGTNWSENDFFQDVWQRLDSIKDAQRDSTMHVETIHTEAEAALIFRSTEAFMKKVAARMDERGEPKASAS